MKNVSNLKKAFSWTSPLFFLACLFVFSSNTDTKSSDQQVIAQLSADLEQMNEKLDLLQTKTADCGMSYEPFLAEINIFAGNFAPRGWAFCDGQLLPIAQNEALFSLIGTMYGGDGRRTFQLPDLRGKIPVHAKEGGILNNIQAGRDSPSQNLALGVQEVKYIIATQGIFPSRN